MQDFDATMEDTGAGTTDRAVIAGRIWDFLVGLFKKLVVFVSFGPGILGVLWLLGRIIRR